MKTLADYPEINVRKPEGIASTGKGFRVLVVDDSIFVKKQLTQILTSEGFDVVASAADGLEAVDKYMELYPNIDLVTMDITMPKMDGVTALEKIVEFDKDAKVVLVSALDRQDLVKKSFLVGAKNYVIKPLNRQKVLDRILSVVQDD